MNETRLSPLGVELTDCSVAVLDDDDLARVRMLLAEHGVVVFRDQQIDDDAFVAFLREFGELAFTAGEQPLEGQPDLNVITNVGRTTPPRSVFHVDTSYVDPPPAYTALRAVTIPRDGGETVFSDQYRAYETLPDDVRDRLAGRSIRHVVTGVEPGPGEQTEAWHPVFRPHPVTDRVALYLSTPQRCVEVSGLDDAESRRTVEQLYAHSTRADNCYRHAWRPGDIVVWDNACVMHRADHSAVVGDRVMHRGMVHGTVRGTVRDPVRDPAPGPVSQQ